MGYILAGGCSYTDQNYRIDTPDALGLEYLDRQIIPWDAWPAVIAKRLNKRCVNLGLSAAGNEYIINVLYDYILKAEEPPDEIYVMLSGWDRVNVLNKGLMTYSFLYMSDLKIRLSKLINPTANELALLRKAEYFESDGKWKTMKDYSFYLMQNHITIDVLIHNTLMPLYIFCKFCVDQRIKLTIANGIGPWPWYWKTTSEDAHAPQTDKTTKIRKDLCNMNKVQEKLINNFYFNKIEDLIDNDKISAIFWPFFKGIGGNYIDNRRPKPPVLTHSISEYDTHPNALAHEMFADYMMGKVV